jgi:excisionase family DNA binding protein
VKKVLYLALMPLQVLMLGEIMNEMSDRWLSAKEICSYMGVSSDTVYRWVETHEMPVHRMGRLFKFKISEIDAWVKAGGASRKQQKVDSK